MISFVNWYRALEPTRVFCSLFACILLQIPFSGYVVLLESSFLSWSPVLFVVVFLTSGYPVFGQNRTLFCRPFWGSDTFKFRIGVLDHEVGYRGLPTWWGPGSLSLIHMSFVVLICFLLTDHTPMYIYSFVIMIGQLLCMNFTCMAIKIFDFTLLDWHGLRSFNSLGPILFWC